MQKLNQDDYTPDQWAEICLRFGKSNSAHHIMVDEDYDYFSDPDMAMDDEPQDIEDFEEYMYPDQDAEYEDD